MKNILQAWEGLLVPDSLLEHYLNISRMLAGQLDFKSIIQAISSEIKQILPYDHMDICIKSVDGQFHIAYEDSANTLWSQLPPAPLASSPIRTLLSGSVDHLMTDDARIDPRFHFPGANSSPILLLGLRSRIHVPLKVNGSIIGALSCSTLDCATYNRSDIERAQSIADMLAPYFFAIRANEQANRSAIEEAEANARAEGLRLGAFQLTQELEAERQRIGMDLHDQTLADLTRMSRRLTRLSHQSEINGDALEPLLNSLQDCMQELRQIIDDAKPSVLHLFGLVDAIETFLEKSIRDNGSSVDWKINDQTAGGFDRLDETVTTALFRIVQEALNNAVRHAQAQNITVTLKATKFACEIIVRDDGTGMLRTSLQRGRGIDNMNTRARLIGADLTIEPYLNQGGTAVTITLCCPTPEKH